MQKATEEEWISPEQMIFIGQRIQQLQIDHGMTGADMAALLDVGVNQVSRIENGRATLTFKNLMILKKHFGVSAEFILEGKENKPEREEVAEILDGLTPEQLNGLKLFLSTMRK